MTFVSGPILLLTTRLSAKSASMMIMLCVPALLLALLQTVPRFLFNSPEQHAYYEFANLINQDASQLAVLALATACSVIALAIPATAPTPFTAVRS